MLSLSFTFLAGRYHATPWERHVNEGAVAWPPEPLRLLRALIATWHHKVKHAGRHQETTLLKLVESLAMELPHYTLPPASHSHTRHYMPQWKPGDTSLVFDAFAAVDRDAQLYVTWPSLDLPHDQAALLDDLLAVIGYLGRAESWVEATRAMNPHEPNCVPGSEACDPGTGEVRGEIVTLFASLPSTEYRSLREHFLTTRREAKALRSTLPESLVDALSVETSALRKHGWSQPPVARKTSYIRPVDALRSKRVTFEIPSPNFTTVRYILVGKPLPRVEDSVRIGELFRSAIMSQARQQLGEDAIPPVISGHDLPSGSKHRHAFYLPWDANGDGRIDRLLMHVPAGMGAHERGIAEKIQHIWSRLDGSKWDLVLESIGSATVGGALTDRTSEWRSITPYLHPWHAKKNFAIEDQIRRECRERDIPEPISLERVEEILVGENQQTRRRRPIHFRRFRNKRAISQPDRQGSFWRLVFPEPIDGPLALGFACHFGLGLFAPTSLASATADQ